MTIIISCGDEKLETDKPVQAKDLYIGPVFRLAWKKATTLRSNVLILSAGYGLVKPNDLLMPYDRRMISRIATYIKKTTPPIADSVHLMSFLYGRAVPFAKPLLPPNLTLGNFISAIKKIPDGPYKYEKQKDGKILQMLPLETLKQEHRRPNGSVKAMRDFLLENFADVHEIATWMESQFGPPLGASYMPTIRTQLRLLPQKYNLEVIRQGNKFKFVRKTNAQLA